MLLFKEHMRYIWNDLSVCVYLCLKEKERERYPIFINDPYQCVLQASVCTQAIREQIPSWFNH